MTPSPFELLLLALAAYRIWRLIAEDTILDRPRAWLLGVPGWLPTAHETPPDGYRDKLAVFLTCPHCAGFWISVLTWLSWIAAGDWATAAAVPWAISALVGLIAQNLDK